MEYLEEKYIEFIYECLNCGNSFQLNRKIESTRCRDCGHHDLDVAEVEVKRKLQLCPICNRFFLTSEYLKEQITDKQALWLANMVTHYRHCHITSWNKLFGRGSSYYQQAAHYSEEDYERLKREVNERAKRQIVRKALNYLILNNFKIEHFKILRNTTPQTIELCLKKNLPE